MKVLILLLASIVTALGQCGPYGQIIKNPMTHQWDCTGNGSSATPTTPGGSNTQIQFNNSGAFGGSANFIWNGSALVLGSTFSAAYATGKTRIGAGVFGSAESNITNSLAAFGDDETSLASEIQGYTNPGRIMVVNGNGGSAEGNGISIEISGGNGGTGIYAVGYIKADGTGPDESIEGDAYSEDPGKDARGGGFFASAEGDGATANAILTGTAVGSYHTAANAVLNSIHIQSPTINGGSSAAIVRGLLIDDQSGGSSNFAIKTGTGKVEFGDTVKATGYLSSDGTAGFTGSCGAATTATVKNGLITGCS